MLGQLAPVEAASPAIYMLAEHLDAILATGEDILAIERSPPDEPGATRLTADLLFDRLDSDHAFVAEIEVLEAALLSRVMQARVRAAEVVRLDVRFRHVVALFLATTHPAADAVSRLGAWRRARERIKLGSDPAAYLRDRGVGEEARPSLSFRLSGTIELGPLLDLAASFLSALEIHYELFEAADAVAERTSGPPGFASLVQSEPSPTRVTTAEPELRVL